MEKMILLPENSLQTLFGSNREFNINNANCIREFNAYFYLRVHYNQYNKLLCEFSKQCLLLSEKSNTNNAKRIRKLTRDSFYLYQIIKFKQYLVLSEKLK